MGIFTGVSERAANASAAHRAGGRSGRWALGIAFRLEPNINVKDASHRDKVCAAVRPLSGVHSYSSGTCPLPRPAS